MAVRWTEGFDHYAASEYLRKWSSGAQGTLQTSTSRHSYGQYLRLADWGNDRSFQFPWGALTTIILGFAWRRNGDSGVDQPIVRFFDAGSSQCGLYLNTGTNLLSLRRAATQVAVGTTALIQDIWYYIELKTVIANAGGTLEVRLNGSGSAEATFSGDTQATANATANSLTLLNGTGVVRNLEFDDMYIDDANYLGDARIFTIFPNGNGNSSQLDGSDGNTTDNYLLVDDTTDADDDTTYVESADVGDKDTYAFEDISATGTVNAVQINPLIRKTDAGTREAVSVARLSGTETDSSAKTPTTSYLYHPDIRTTKPGGGAWSVTDINNAEFGLKIST